MSLPMNHAAEFSALVAAQLRTDLRRAIDATVARAAELQAESDEWYRYNEFDSGAAVGREAINMAESAARLAARLAKLESMVS